MTKLIVFSVCCLLLTGYVTCSPIWLDQLFGAPSRPFANPRPSQPSGQRQPRDRFRPICRVISGDNYAFPNKVPFPAAPFCPFGSK